MEGLTFDTGALIALERRTQRIAKILHLARLRNLTITVPSPVVAEWWRGQTGEIADLLRGVQVEPLTERLAKSAGEALAKTKRRNVVDAIVIASAATRGDIVYTSDVEDLTRLTSVFPSVRVLRV